MVGLANGCRCVCSRLRVDLRVVVRIERPAGRCRTFSFDAEWNIARIAAKNKIVLALDLNDFRPISQLEQSRVLARLAFIIPMLRKASVPLKLINARDPRGAQALLRVLGDSSQQAQACCDSTVKY